MLRPKRWQSANPNPHVLQPWIEGLAIRLGAPPEGSLQFVGISACASGDGATTIACAVASRIQAGLGKRVLLVDANTRSPDLHRRYSQPISPGLADLLNGQCTLREAVRTVDESGLCVITAGTSSASSLGLFDSETLAAMKAHLIEYFDTIIFDCPPLSGDGETFVLAKRLDGLVIVLAAEKTRWERGAQMMERLQAAKINVLGAALNGKRFFIPRLIYKRL